ncbi:putative invertase inhibitor [Silene latifolia]|uniref:putative invertase inhibitor n=1 Tax=Silene latifolia TaxID=37657 RepID=UPI003D784A9D
MKNVLLILPLAFGLVILAHATSSNPPTEAKQVTNKGENGKNNPLITKACASAQYKDLCIKTLKEQPGSANADIKTLAFMSLNITTSFGKMVSDWVAEKLEDPELGPQIEQALTDCSDQYTDAMAQLEDSMVAFFSNAFNDVKTWMSTAMTNANTCEEGLKTANAIKVMGNKNKEFSQYCSNVLAIVNEMTKLRLE